jgi:hypothetical protein
MNQFDLIKKRVARLGNHYQKYLHTIEKNKDELIKALHSTGKLMQVHLWRISLDPEEEMKIINKLSSDLKTQVRFTSCYYALQYLHMNFRNLDILELGITSGSNSIDIYHNFITQFGVEFRNLTKIYLENLLDIFIPDQIRPEFFIISVGTRADQDDIDAGVIIADDSDATEFNKAFQKVAQNMLVNATVLHMYLSEHVGREVYTTTISEYKELIDKKMQDVIIITELLNAKLISGSENLFYKFYDEVINKYYYGQEHDSKLHERFLRGILGEARAHLLMPLQRDTICPKDDALRLIKSLLYAKRTVYNITEVTAWEIISTLIEVEPKLKSEYELLSKALSFLEIFKFLLQLYIVQEEHFRPDEIDKNQLAMIAQKMGYSPIGTVNAWDQLIIDYYRYVKEIRKICDFLIKDITNHLGKITLFTKVLDYRSIKKYNKNLAIDFIKNAKFFEGTKYWEDLLIRLENNKKIIDQFVKGFQALSSKERTNLIKKYVKWTEYSPTTFIRFITIFGKNQQIPDSQVLFKDMNLEFLKYFIEMPYNAVRIYRIFSLYPKIIHEYLQFLPESHYQLFKELLKQPLVDDRLKEYQIQLKELFKIHKWSSLYFHRFFYRVILNHPEYLTSLTNTQQLSKIASGLLAMVSNYPDAKQQKKILGDYYDLDFLRVGIGTINGVKLEVTNREFTEFCDNYIQKLFDICTEEVEDESEAEPPNTDTFAILAAGGHSRSQAYDDDYDLIAIVDTDDDIIIKHATRIITKMNREIVKRGVLPHYRLGEILEGFVVPISKIVDYLKSESEESFIDLSQLLGARIVVGSNVMRVVINDKILRPLIFDKKSYYILRMITEINSRQSITKNCDNETCNLKETKGGLRDIEAVALMLKAYFGIGTPLSHNFFRKIKPKLLIINNELDIISESLYFLRTIRNLYRITIAAEDDLQSVYFSSLADIYFGKEINNGPELLKKKIQAALNNSANACNVIIKYLKNELSLT